MMERGMDFMKRIAWVWLLVLALLPLGGLAEGAEWTTYTHPVGDYSIDYPSDWTVMDADSIDKIWDDVTAGKIKGLDPATLQGNEQMVREGGLALFVAPSGALNCNIMFQDIGAELTMPELIEAACPSAIADFGQMFQEMEVLQGGGEMAAGDVHYAYVLVQANAGGEQVIISQAYTMKGTIVYIVTYTVFPDRGIDMDEVSAVTERIGASFK